jgi:hypothetical protein
MKIKTEKNYLGEWIAYDEDTYDGAIDGNNLYGIGDTKEEAIEDLKAFTDLENYTKGVMSGE